MHRCQRAVELMFEVCECVQSVHEELIRDFRLNKKARHSLSAGIFFHEDLRAHLFTCDECFEDAEASEDATPVSGPDASIDTSEKTPGR